jgi:SAM-dependent methyltransferase
MEDKLLPEGKNKMIQLKNIMKLITGLGAKEEHWVRVIMNRETRKMIEKLNLNDFEVLEISGSAWKSRFDYRSYQSVQFPEFDICKNPLAQKFDLIIAEQVFEHLLWPYKAGKNVYSMLNPGGYFLITTPFLLRIHPSPHDCSRWSETGLKYLLAECGFSIENIQSGSWGNRKCIISNLGKWTAYNPFFHSLKNEPFYPGVVWALAKK